MNTEVTEKKRFFTEINVARGIAVLLVLLGHSFPDSQTGITSPVAKSIFNFVYAFHMETFFALAGFVAAKKVFSDEINFGKEFVNKFKRLFIPYLIYSLVTLVLKVFMNDYANNRFELSDAWKILIGNNPNGGLWYLWTLFFISLSVLLIGITLKGNNGNSKCFVFAIIGIVAYIVWIFVIHGYTFLEFPGRIVRYAAYYNIGLIFAYHYDSVNKKMFNAICGLALFIAVFFLVNSNAKGIIYYLRLVISCMGIYGVYSISCFIDSRKNKVRDTFMGLGDYSYDIYLLSYFVQIPIRVILYRILGMNYWIVVACMFVFGLIIPILVSKFIIRRVGLFKKLLLGDWK